MHNDEAWAQIRTPIEQCLSKHMHAFTPRCRHACIRHACMHAHMYARTHNACTQAGQHAVGCGLGLKLVLAIGGAGHQTFHFVVDRLQATTKISAAVARLSHARRVSAHQAVCRPPFCNDILSPATQLFAAGCLTSHWAHSLPGHWARSLPGHWARSLPGHWARSLPGH